MRKVVILSFLTSLLLGACGEDDYVYPNVLTDMIDLKTDHTGTGRYLITDEGTEWRIQSRTGLDGLAPDTTYRTVTMYAPLTDSEEAEKEAMLYNTQLVISPVPLSESKFKEIKTDPVAIQSIWRGGNYLNLILQVTHLNDHDSIPQTLRSYFYWYILLQLVTHSLSLQFLN